MLVEKKKKKKEETGIKLKENGKYLRNLLSLITAVTKALNLN